MYKVALLSWWFLLVAIGESQADEPKTPSVFDLPRLRIVQLQEQRRALQLMADGDHAAAEQQLRKSVKRIPHDVNAHYNLACVLARQKNSQEALTTLQTAVELGFRDRDKIAADKDFAALRDDKRFQAILAAAEIPLKTPIAGWKYHITPARPVDGQVVIKESAVTWNGRRGVFQAFLDLQDATTAQPIAKEFGKTGELLRRWYEEGTAAGNHGDVYDNHDSDHSNMNFRAFPQLTRIEYSPAAKQRRLHHGLQTLFLYNAVTIGNSSTALTSGPLWRSQGRLALTQPAGAQRLYQQYRTNHLYFYPEHRDHDLGPAARAKGHGDVFPANTPYLILSQGSSGSDRPFLDAVAATLAAFHPDVKQRLAKTGMLIPTVQMIFRRCNKNVLTDKDYLSGIAHPTVFEGGRLNVAKMVKMAHAMTLECLPPLVQLKVVEQETSVVGRDYFDVGPRERLFDTPCAIARIVKSSKYRRRMVVSAAGSIDLHQQPLRFHWVLLRGDRDLVQINPLNASGSDAELLVAYHPRRPISAGSKFHSNRVDIGVFAENAEYYSPPGFISFFYLNNEKRKYDQQHRILTVDYTHPVARKNYVDPLLDLKKDWRDEYRYDDDGQLSGWTRTRGTHTEEFSAQGRLVVEADAEDMPVKTVEVRYTAEPKSKAKLQQVVIPE